MYTARGFRTTVAVAVAVAVPPLPLSLLSSSFPFAVKCRGNLFLSISATPVYSHTISFPQLSFHAIVQFSQFCTPRLCGVFIVKIFLLFSVERFVSLFIPLPFLERGRTTSIGVPLPSNLSLSFDQPLLQFVHFLFYLFWFGYMERN